MTNLLFMAALAAANPTNAVPIATVDAWTQLTNKVQILWVEREERKARIEAARKRRERERNGPPNAPFRVKRSNRFGNGGAK